MSGLSFHFKKWIVNIVLMDTQHLDKFVSFSYQIVINSSAVMNFHLNR
jgi:hypothetical protein